jgi:hypothetical protein
MFTHNLSIFAQKICKQVFLKSFLIKALALGKSISTMRLSLRGDKEKLRKYRLNQALEASIFMRCLDDAM